MIYRNVRPKRLQPEQAARGENRELLRLLTTVSVILIGSVFIVDRLTVWFAPSLPFSLERRLAETLHLDSMTGSMLGGRARSSGGAIQAALQHRADNIMRVLEGPADMPVQIHYMEGDTVNAVATLGGHITVFQGLLEKLRYQEELDAVLAHEIGHVLHRHMIQHLSRGVMTAVGLGLIGIRSSSLNRWLIGDLQQLQQLAYSREAEREADDTALLASQRLYGHTDGVVSIFQLFDRLQTGAAPAWTQSHPLPEDRARRAREQAGAIGTSSHLTPLPAVFKPQRE